MMKLREIMEALRAATAEEAAAMLEEHAYLSTYDVGERVRVDDDGSIMFVVTALKWTGTEATYVVEWFSNGDAKSMWVEEWRLSRTDANVPASSIGITNNTGDDPPPHQTVGFVGGVRR